MDDMDMDYHADDCQCEDCLVMAEVLADGDERLSDWLSVYMEESCE